MTRYSTRYCTSHALVLGVSRYAHATELDCAANDASLVADTLRNDCGFERITLLQDERATKASFLKAFYGLCHQTLDDDRVVVFIAAHGVSKWSIHGDRGFMVPFDGDTSEIESLVPFDELTR